MTGRERSIAECAPFHVGYRESPVVIVGSAIGACLLLALAAQVRIPVPGTEVPMTLQLLAVLMIGFIFSAKSVVLALLGYLALGAAGVPVFSPGSPGLWGPTGGYLVGFLPAALLVSLLRGPREAGLVRLLGAGAVGVTVVFACGIGWRIAWLVGDWRLALQTGLSPFILKATVELCLAAMLMKSIHRWRHRRRKIFSGRIK